MIREKQIKSGPLLECDFFPITETGRKIPSKGAAQTKAQSEYNSRQAVKKLIRLVNANFDNTDILMHPTYNPANAPQTEEEARRDIVNYLRRMKNYRKSEIKKLKRYIREHPEDKALSDKLKKLEAPFKYIYAIEKQTYKTGIYAGRVNWHFHMFMTGSGAGDRDKAEELWPHGIRTNADRFRPEMWGPEAAARYISKDPQGSKRYACSRNLDKPKTKTKDGRVSARQLERWAKERIDDREFWERRYKGYKLLRCYPRLNPYNDRWYMSVVLYKTDVSPPKWTVGDWLTEDLPQ